MFDFIAKGLQDFRQDVNTLIERDWQRKDAASQRDREDLFWQKNYDAQKEFAKHGIQWRVEDAQAAGLHPVFSLGSGGAAFAPSVAIGGSPSVPSFHGSSGLGGQNVSRAAKAEMTEEQRRMAELQERAALANIERIESETFLNYMRAGNLQGNASNGLGSADPNVAVGLPAGPGNPAAGLITVKPDESTSYAASDTSLTAAKRPMWSLFRVHTGPGGEWVLPHAQTGAESFESIGEGVAPLWLTIRENMARDPQFLERNKRYIPFYDAVTGTRDWLNEAGGSLGRAIAGGVEALRGDPHARRRRPYIREDYRWSNRR